MSGRSLTDFFHKQLIGEFRCRSRGGERTSERLTRSSANDLQSLSVRKQSGGADFAVHSRFTAVRVVSGSLYPQVGSQFVS